MIVPGNRSTFRAVNTRLDDSDGRHEHHPGFVVSSRIRLEPRRNEVFSCSFVAHYGVLTARNDVEGDFVLTCSVNASYVPRLCFPCARDSIVRNINANAINGD